MSDAKFTPGPWRVCNDGSGVCAVNPVDGWKEYAVCCTYFPFTHSKEEERANASLCAAAPEMYAALEAQCDDCHKKDNETCDVCIVGDALRKARGEG